VTGPTGPAGSPGYPSTRTTVSASTYNALITDEYLGVSYSGNVTINLPAGVNSKGMIIKDEGGSASLNPITVVPNGVQTIDGQPSVNINTDLGAATVWFHGGVWHVISRA
jgi:hypothetical protein